MSTDHNRRIALAMIDKISQGIIDDALVTEDVRWWIPGTGEVSRAEFQKIVEVFLALREGTGRMDIHGVTAEGDRVAVEAESHMTLKGGRQYNNTYHLLFEFRDGRICKAKEYNDSRYAAEVLGNIAQRL